MNRSELMKKIMIALDFPSVAEAQALLDRLQDYRCYVKVGMELFYAAGPSFVEQLKKQGYYVFLDLKLHDIPNTVLGAAKSITRLGVDMFNVHAAGGKRMMEAALEGVEQGISYLSHSSDLKKENHPIVIAVTQLTSTSEEMMNREIGIPGSIDDAVRHYARLAKESGLHGVVSSPRETKLVKKECGNDFIVVTPGIRPSWSQKGDQQRISTPEEAIELGADYLVIGRAITQSENPERALQKIIEELV